MGFIRIDRDIEHHWVYQDPEYFKVWFEILLRARYAADPTKVLVGGQFVTVEYGQFIYGRTSWSQRLKVSEQRLRTIFKKLQDDQMIELIKSSPKLTIYAVKNYAKFNHQNNQQTNQQESLVAVGESGIGNQQNNQQTNHLSTSYQPSTNHLPTTKEESKESKERKEGKKKINGRKKASALDHLKNNYAEFVRLTPEQHEKLISEHGEHAVKEMIEILNSYKASNGKEYESDYHTMIGRGWVLDRYRKETLKKVPQQQTKQSRWERQVDELQSLYAEAEAREREGNGSY